MSIFKKGDLVQVIDGSYSLSIDNGEFEHAWGINLRDREFEVINTDMKLPSTDEDKGQFNTMIIKAKDNGQIVFTQERMVKPVTKKEDNIIYNITIIVGENIDADKLIEELERKLKVSSLNVHAWRTKNVKNT